MSVDKPGKELELDAAAASASASDESPDGSEGQPRRKKRTGLRVPSDNVPRPDNRRTLPMPETPQPSSSSPGLPPVGGPVSDGVPQVVTIMPNRSGSVPPASAASGQGIPSGVRAPTAGPSEDLDLEVELIEDDARRSGEMKAAEEPAGSAVGDGDGEVFAPSPTTVDVSGGWTAPPDELLGDSDTGSGSDDDATDDLAAEPTLIQQPPPELRRQIRDTEPVPTTIEPFGSPPRLVSESEGAPAIVVAAAQALAAGGTIDASPVPQPTRATSVPAEASVEVDEDSLTAVRATTAESEDAEELSPLEYEEVESGPTSTQHTGPAMPMTPVLPSQPATPAQAAAVAASAGQTRPTAPPPPPPPKAQPPAPPPKAAAVAAVAAAVVKDKPAAKKRKGKAWYEEIFDEDYLRTLPFLTPQATQREAAFIIEALQLRPGMQVLDLGSGYGRHAMELAARGHHVVGLDLSLPLLIRGADEAQRRGLSINFVHGDMRELTFDAQFDGAYCVFSTFGYFDDETNKRVAQNLARALKPGGRLVIDVLNRDYVITDLPTRVWWEGDGCVVLEEVDFNYFTSRVISNRSVVFEDGRQLEQEISMRAYSLHELGKLLHTAGFRVLEVSGGLATRGRFFGHSSRQIVVVAEKRSDSGPSTTQPPPTG